MEMPEGDVAHIRSLLECALNVAVFPYSVPNSVRASFFVEDAAIGEGLLGFDDGFERLILNLDEFSGIVGKTRRLRGHSCRRFPLIKDLAHGHGEVTNFLSVVGADFDEGLGLRGNFLSGNRTYYP